MTSKYYHPASYASRLGITVEEWHAKRDAGLRRCSGRCKDWKPRTAFKPGTCSDGLDWRCRACFNQARQEWRKRRKQQ